MERFPRRGLRTCIAVASWMFQLTGRRVGRLVLIKVLYNLLKILRLEARFGGHLSVHVVLNNVQIDVSVD